MEVGWWSGESVPEGEVEVEGVRLDLINMVGCVAVCGLCGSLDVAHVAVAAAEPHCGAR